MGCVLYSALVNVLGVTPDTGCTTFSEAPGSPAGALGFLEVVRYTYIVELLKQRLPSV